MKEDLNPLVFRKSAPKIIVACKQEYIRHCKFRIATEANTTYSHVVKILAKLESNGLVAIEKTGRNCITSLTEKGMEVANLIERVNELLRISE